MLRRPDESDTVRPELDSYSEGELRMVPFLTDGTEAKSTRALLGMDGYFGRSCAFRAWTCWASSPSTNFTARSAA